MNDNDRLYDIEKSIGVSMRESAGPSAPPFEKIAGKIAAGQPAESFEEFFAGDIPVSKTKSAAKQSRSIRGRVKIIAGASAAALLLFIGGGALAGAVISGTFSGAKSAAASVDGSCYENYDSLADRAEEFREETSQECVSESDLNDSILPDSSDTSK